MPITFPEAVLGTDLRVPTLDGTVTLRVPPGTPSGRVLRARGKGVARKDGRAGDLLVTLDVVVPAKLSDEARAALEEFVRTADPARPRGNISTRGCVDSVDRYDAAEVSGDVGEFVGSGDPAYEAKVLMISVAARMAGMHPQTLRQYDRLGLVQPGRAAGGGRRYSVRDVVLLREVQRLSQDDGSQPGRGQADHRAGAAGGAGPAAGGPAGGGTGRRVPADRRAGGAGHLPAAGPRAHQPHLDGAGRLASAPEPGALTHSPLDRLVHAGPARSSGNSPARAGPLSLA